ncbi:MAG: hypothetical protein QOH29_2337, partial [Actinomycetota bacterium]|nr:hypothetical protein [Actinomycetota bacterium]
MTVAEPLEIEERHTIAVHSSRRARLASGWILVGVGFICIFALGLGSKSGYDARFTLSPAGAKITVPTVVLPARLTAIVLGVIVAALGGWRIVRDYSRRAMRWVIAFALFSLVFSFMCWALT